MNVFRLLGWKVKNIRVAKEMTQEELAFRVGAVDQAYISELEHGKGNPTLQVIYCLSLALETSMSELLSTDGAPADVVKGPSKRRIRKNGLK